MSPAQLELVLPVLQVVASELSFITLKWRATSALRLLDVPKLTDSSACPRYRAGRRNNEAEVEGAVSAAAQV